MSEINFRDLVDQHLNGTISHDDFDRLKEWLRDHSDHREEYLSAVKMDTLLREIAGQNSEVESPRLAAKPNRRLLLLSMVSALAVLGLAAFLLFQTAAPAAKITAVSDTDSKWEPGDYLQASDRVELTQGKLSLTFSSGATTELHAPVLFEVSSANSAFLHYGNAVSRADTDASHGFTILTPYGQFIDQGTEFLTTVRRDGSSQMHVSSGEVDVAVKGFGRQRIRKGSGIGIESGSVPVMIRIEQGEESSDFLFPSITPPAHTDDGKTANAQLFQSGSDWQEIPPHRESGSLSLLTDGFAQSTQDQPEESLFPPNGADAAILLDLQKAIPVAMIRTYSWHLSEVDVGTRRRAVQRYTVWGSKEKPKQLPIAEEARGWTRIARVDTDAFFQVAEDPDRPAQQACELFSSDGQSLGKFRYLLFDVVPTPMPTGIPPQHTFFGEIDVIAE